MSERPLCSQTMTVTGVMKTARLLRLLRVARRVDQYSEYGAAVLLLLMASFILISHWLACIFYAIAYFERPRLDTPISWLDQLARKTGAPYLANDTASGPDIRSRYITSLYFTFTIITSVGFGNVAAVTDAEKVFTIFAMLIGCELTLLTLVTSSLSQNKHIERRCTPKVTRTVGGMRPNVMVARSCCGWRHLTNTIKYAVITMDSRTTENY